MQKVLYYSGRTLIELLTRLALDLDVRWHAPLPRGPKVIVANHPTTTDPFYILALAREPMSILVTGDVFRIPLLGRYLRAAGHIPVIKTNGRPAFDKALALLRAGQTIGIFPEGRLSPMVDGDTSRPTLGSRPMGGLSPIPGEIAIARARSGTARLALGAGVAVVPVGIHLPQNRIRHIEGKINGTVGFARLVRRGPYAMTVGEPLRFTGDPEDRELVRLVSEQIMDQIAALRHQSRRRLALQKHQVLSLRPCRPEGTLSLPLMADNLPIL